MATATQHRVYRPVKPSPGPPANKKKPIRNRLYRAGITYGQVATRAGRAHVSVRAHIDGRIFSPAIDQAIRELLAEAAGKKGGAT